MSKNKKGSLSDKISNILSTTPGQIDPEDDIYDETTARVTTNESDEDIEQSSSKFRKRNVDLLEDVDSRYVGKKSSRKSLQNSDDEWETEDEGLSTDEGEALDGVPGTQEPGNESDDFDDDSNEEMSDNSEGKENSGNEDESGFKHLSKHALLNNDQKKGNAVRNQLNIWENLLEIRIQLQKCLLTANKLPQNETFTALKSEKDFNAMISVTKKNVTNMLDKFLSLQTILLKQYNETSSLFKEKQENKTESDEEIPSDTDEEISSDDDKSEGSEDESPKKCIKLSDFETKINVRNEKYKNYRNATIQKWNDKTRLSVGKQGTPNSVLQQIDYILADKPKLLKRTQLKRSNFEILGKKSENEAQEEYDLEIYDDTDFYHQLLRELIEVKSGDVTDPVQMSRQWIALQNVRSKMKRKIDMKATKGRKIRYVVHSKLVNFMAPIANHSWTDDAKNELYGSLFGKVN